MPQAANLVHHGMGQSVWGRPGSTEGPTGTSLVLTWPTVLPGMYLLVLFPLNLSLPGTGTLAGALLLTAGGEAVWGEVQLCFQHL